MVNELYKFLSVKWSC